MPRQFQNFIASEWVVPADGQYFETRNPADSSDVIGLWPRSTRADVERAATCARRGFERWRRTPAPLRGAVIRRAGDLLAQRKEEIARAMTREMGKVLKETLRDVREGHRYRLLRGDRRTAPVRPHRSE